MSGEPPDEGREDRRVAVTIVAAVLVAALGALAAWWLWGGDDDVVPSNTSESTTSSSHPETTGTIAPPATTGSNLSEEELATAVWPDQASSRRFDDPVAAAYAFATDVVGFAQPEVDDFQQGDETSGAVDVRADAGGPVTTVQVRRMGQDDTWWILGAQTPDIEVTDPEPGASIASPLSPQGRSRAFEGTVDVRVFVDGSDEPVGVGFVMGGATEELAPFSGQVEFDHGDAAWGMVVFSVASAEDGQARQGTVVRVAFEP